MAPQGKFGLIDDPAEFNVSVFKGKAVSIHWESMFTRSSFQTPDMIAQHHLLNDVADLIDKGVLRTTLDQTFRHHQCRQSEAGPCVAGIRQIARQDRAGGLVAVFVTATQSGRRELHARWVWTMPPSTRSAAPLVADAFWKQT